MLLLCRFFRFLEKLMISSEDEPSWFIHIIANTLTMGMDARTAASMVLRSLTCTTAKMMRAVRPIFPASKTQLMWSELTIQRSTFAVNLMSLATNANQMSHRRGLFSVHRMPWEGLSLWKGTLPISDRRMRSGGPFSTSSKFDSTLPVTFAWLPVHFDCWSFQNQRS